MSSSREASKALEASRLAAEAADRERTRLLRAALRKHHSQRTADDDAALAADPEETARMKAAMEKAAARKASEAEVEEDDSTVYAKVQRLAHLLRSASHAVVYTGAGISTAADIPDYRGPQGVWTLQKKGGKRKRKQILETPEVAVESPLAAAPAVAEAQAPSDENYDLGADALIFYLFKGMSKEKQKDLVCMLVMEI